MLLHIKRRKLKEVKLPDRPQTYNLLILVFISINTISILFITMTYTDEERNCTRI